MSDVIDTEQKSTSAPRRSKNVGSRVSALAESGTSEAGPLEVVRRVVGKGVEDLDSGGEDLAVVGVTGEKKRSSKKKREAAGVDLTGADTEPPKDGTEDVAQVVRDQVRQLRAKKKKEATTASGSNKNATAAALPTAEARKACCATMRV